VYGWELQAWIILPNHYRFLAQSHDWNPNLDRLVWSIHSKSALLVNRLDHSPGRRVWYNYFDTCIRSEAEYYARLKYILLNPERHGLVEDDREYDFSIYSRMKYRNPFESKNSDSMDEVFNFAIFDSF
jgi:putative transposase